MVKVTKKKTGKKEGKSKVRGQRVSRTGGEHAVQKKVSAKQYRALHRSLSFLDLLKQNINKALPYEESRNEQIASKLVEASGAFKPQFEPETLRNPPDEAKFPKHEIGLEPLSYMYSDHPVNSKHVVGRQKINPAMSESLTDVPHHETVIFHKLNPNPAKPSISAHPNADFEDLKQSHNEHTKGWAPGHHLKAVGHLMDELGRIHQATVRSDPKADRTHLHRTAEAVASHAFMHLNSIFKKRGNQKTYKFQNEDRPVSSHPLHKLARGLWDALQTGGGEAVINKFAEPELTEKSVGSDVADLLKAIRPDELNRPQLLTDDKDYEEVKTSGNLRAIYRPQNSRHVLSGSFGQQKAARAQFNEDHAHWNPIDHAHAIHHYITALPHAASQNDKWHFLNMAKHAVLHGSELGKQLKSALPVSFNAKPGVHNALSHEHINQAVTIASGVKPAHEGNEAKQFIQHMREASGHLLQGFLGKPPKMSKQELRQKDIVSAIEGNVGVNMVRSRKEKKTLNKAAFLPLLGRVAGAVMSTVASRLLDKKPKPELEANTEYSTKAEQHEEWVKANIASQITNKAFVSQAQRRYFYAAEKRGEIPSSVVKEFEDKTAKNKKLPERVKPKR